SEPISRLRQTAKSARSFERIVRKRFIGLQRLCFLLRLFLLSSWTGRFYFLHLRRRDSRRPGFCTAEGLGVVTRLKPLQQLRFVVDLAGGFIEVLSMLTPGDLFAKALACFGRCHVLDE